ncbi:MAG TPA: hypothetical protein VMW17_18395 [Candidatus Binatia bacterium]|nr:hypothetical protein [Candidatus Binatia bacterium]
MNTLTAKDAHLTVVHRRRAEKFLDHGRLADAGLASHEDYLACAAMRPADTLLDCAQLTLASDEH